jgi:pimeloyl-ACP methyl ester carboxylesterase
MDTDVTQSRPKKSPRFHDLDAELPGRGITLRYRDWGGSGPPVVLLHGLSSSLTIWDFTAPILAERFHVIAVDQRGHGLSSKPEDGYGFDDVTTDLAAFLQVTGIEQPLIVGHSWGGNVAVQFAADHAGVPRGLVLVDGGFIERSSDATWEQAEREMRPPEIDGTPVERFVDFMSRWPHIKDIFSVQLQDMILYNFDIRDDKIYRRLNIPNHMKIARAIFEQRPSELLQRVECSVLVVPAFRETSSEDERRWQAYREHGIAAITKARPSIIVHPMQDTIHDVPIQRPKELAELIASFAGKAG